MLGLYRISHKSAKPNDFARIFPPHFLTAANSLNLRYNSFYFGGLSDAKIYLANYSAPAHLLICDFALKDTQNIVLKVEDGVKIAANAVNVFVDSPYIFIIEGMTPTVLIDSLPDSTLRNLDLPKVHFDMAIPISRSTLVARMYDYSLGRNVYTKLNLEKQTVEKHPEILKPQADGIFSVDGSIHYNGVNDNLIFTYFYRNQFLELDSNLKILLKGNTIDTNTRAKIQVSSITSQGFQTFSSPPLMINKTCWANDTYLFVNSKLRANNEDLFTFKNNAVIDIYNLNSGKYRYSFYIPEAKGMTMTDFRVWGKTLIVLYSHSLMTFHMNI
jgi:hypothetical protein